MPKIKSHRISAAKKRRICVGVMLIIILCGLFCLNTGDKTEMVLKTAVLTADTPLYMNPELSLEYSGNMKQGDLINVVYRHNKDVYYVLDAATELPMNEGYLSADKFTYTFDTANQAVLGTDTVYSKKDTNKPAGYVVEKGRTRCIVNGFEEDWASISLPGGIDGLFVPAKELIYDLNYDLLLAEDFGHYALVKEYMEKEYIDTYDKYYDNNFVRFLTAYDEEYNPDTCQLTAEFIMNGMSKNKYRDPDTVKYIQEAKEAIQGDGDRLYYESLYREYNMYRTGGNFILKLTATVDGDKLTDIKLYSDTGVGSTSDWKELEKGLKNFIIEG